VGLDCIGLIVVAAKAAGLTVQDRTDYGRRPDGQSLIAALEAHGATKATDIRAGDILVFRYDKQPQHVALATSETTMIHSFAPARQVIETPISPYWQTRLSGIYRLE
jgi:cell wall-associated NlpC family hydrolase